MLKDNMFWERFRPDNAVFAREESRIVFTEGDKGTGVFNHGWTRRNTDFDRRKRRERRQKALLEWTRIFSKRNEENGGGARACLFFNPD